MSYMVIFGELPFKGVLDPNNGFEKARPQDLLESLGELPFLLMDGGTAPEIGFKNRFAVNHKQFTGWLPLKGSNWSMDDEDVVSYEGDRNKSPILKITSFKHPLEVALIYDGCWVFVKHQEAWYYTRAD